MSRFKLIARKEHAVHKSSTGKEQTNLLNISRNLSLNISMESLSHILEDPIEFQLWFEKRKNRFCTVELKGIEVFRLIYTLYQENGIPPAIDPSRINQEQAGLLNEYVGSYGIDFIVIAYKRHCLGIPEKENFGYLLKGACLIELKSQKKEQSSKKKSSSNRRSLRTQKTEENYQKLMSGESNLEVIGEGLGLFPNKKIKSIN